MFVRSDYIPNHFGESYLPDGIDTMIKEKRYSNVADSLQRHQIPFNRAFVFLSNCPEALAAYVYASIPEFENEDFAEEQPIEHGEEEENKDKNPEEEKKEKPNDDTQAQPETTNEKPEGEGNEEKPEEKKKEEGISPRSALLMNLYLSIAIPLLTTKDSEERKKETNTIIAMVKKYHYCFDKNNIYKICREISDDELGQAMYLIYDDIWEYSMLMFERQEYDNIIREISKLPEQKRAQVYKRFPPEFHLQMVNYWMKNDLPNSSSIFPMLCDIVFADIFNEAPFVRLQMILEKMYTRRLLLTPPHRQIHYYLLMKANNLEKMEVIYNHDLFSQIGYDFVSRHLERRKQFQFAGNFCGHISDRHYLAVKYALNDSIPYTNTLLTTVLKNAEDIRDCWLVAFNMIQSMTYEENEWKEILKTSASSGVLALDDIFKRMPLEMPIDEFQPTILQSIRKYQQITQKSKDKITQLINRSNEQREVIRVGPSMTCQMDPLAICWFCKGSIYTDRFLVFPCNHSVHVKCFLANCHLYYKPVEILNLISLSSRAMKDEKKASGLANVICKSCPICGELSTNVLEKDFIIKEEQNSRKIWYLPPAIKEETIEDEEKTLK